MRSKTAKIVASFLSIILLFGIFFDANVANADPPGATQCASYEFCWRNSTYISVNRNGITFFVSLLTEKPAGDFGSDESGNTVEMPSYSFYGGYQGDSNDPANFYVLAQKNADRSFGYFKPMSGDQASREIITIADPMGVAPATPKFITKGSIAAGLLYPGDGWANETDKGMSGGVFLEMKNPSGTYEFVGDKSFYYEKVTKSADKYYYNLQIPATSTNFSGLVEGEYRISYYYVSGADCETKIADGVDIFASLSIITNLLETMQNAKRAAMDCQIEFTGENFFSLKYKDGGNGVGIVTVSPTNDGAHETKIYETASTLRQQNESDTDLLAIDTGIDIDVVESFSKKDLLADAINGVLSFVGDFLGNVIGGMLGWIDAELKVGSNFSSNDTLMNVSKTIRNSALGLLTLVLILVAFANILNIPLPDYGLTKIVPKIVLSILMAFFSYLIATFILEIANALQTFIIEAFKSGENQIMIEDGITALKSATGSNIFEAMLLNESLKWQVLLFILIMFGIFLVTIWLLVILVVRKAVLMLLVAVAPLAFILNILPFTSKYYKDWWANFWKWSFMGVPICLLYYLAFIFLSQGYFGAKFSSPDAELSGNYEQWTYLIAAGVLIFLAAKIPLKMGDTIYNGIKNAGGKVAGATGLKARYDAFKAQRQEYGKLKAQKDVSGLRTSLGRMGAIPGIIAGKRGILGTDPSIAERMYMAEIKDMTPEEKQKRLDNLASKGLNETNSAEARILASNVASTIHAAQLDERTKTILAQAVARGLESGASNFSKAIANSIEANPSKDAYIELYNHLNKPGASGVAPIAELSRTMGSAVLALEKKAVGKAAAKTPLERGDGDIKALLNAINRGAAGTEGHTMATETRARDIAFVQSPDGSKALKEKAGTKTQIEQSGHNADYYQGHYDSATTGNQNPGNP